MRGVAPNDPKLSDGGGWRGACPTVERTKTALNANTWRAKIARAVTAVAVRCSALLGVAVEFREVMPAHVVEAEYMAGLIRGLNFDGLPEAQEKFMDSLGWDFSGEVRI